MYAAEIFTEVREAFFHRKSDMRTETARHTADGQKLAEDPSRRRTKDVASNCTVRTAPSDVCAQHDEVLSHAFGVPLQARRVGLHARRGDGDRRRKALKAARALSAQPDTCELRPRPSPHRHLASPSASSQSRRRAPPARQARWRPALHRRCCRRWLRA